MRNEDQWKPTKFRYQGDKILPSRDPKELSLASRMTSSRVAECYNRHLAKHCRGSLLDLGCGKAPYYGAYRPHVDSVYCIDWGSSAHGTDHVDQQADLTQPLPLADQEFDTIILSSVLEHIPTPQDLWKEMHRILRPGGKVIMNVPFMYWLHETPHDFYRYTEYALRRMAEEADFDTITLESTGGAPVVLVDVFSKMLIGVPVVYPIVTRAMFTAASLFLKTSLGKRVDQRSANLIPSGYFLVVQKRTAES